MKPSEYAKQNSISKATVYRMIKAGQLKHKRLPTGTIVIVEDKTADTQPYTVVYARVSSSQNKKNLESQAQRLCDFCYANGWVVNEIIKECASGLNDTRPKLAKILRNPAVTRIVVEHKDRLTRFGFNYIKILSKAEIVIINEVDSDREDLMQDFVSLVTSFCARLYGKRRAKRKTEKLIKELQND